MLYERLEDRRLFAVDVAVTDGVLTITGDAAANLVNVHLVDEDTLVVRTGTEEAVTTEEETDESAPAGPCIGGGRFGELLLTEFDISDEAITSILVNLGDGDDLAHIGLNVELPATINGGAGEDHISGGSGDDTLSGDEGNDEIRGGLGSDVINAGAGNDFVFARDGVTDTIDGGDNEADADGTSGDVAIIDDADGETPDTVTNVESTITQPERGPRHGGPGGGPGFGGPRFGPGGPGGPRHHGPPPADDDGTDDGGADDGSTDDGVTTDAGATVLNVGGVTRAVRLALRQ